MGDFMEVPKHGLIDLHVHLDGSLDFSLAKNLPQTRGWQ